MRGAFLSFHLFLVPVGEPVSPDPLPLPSVCKTGRRRGGGQAQRCPGTWREAQSLWQEEELFSPHPAGRGEGCSLAQDKI